MLLLTARLTGVYRSRGWLALGAAVGAVFAVMLYFPPIPVLPGLLLRGGVCVATALAAFGKQPFGKLVHLCGTFALLTMVLGGSVLAVTAGKAEAVLQNGILYTDISGAVMLISFTAMYGLSGVVLGCGRVQTGRERREVRVKSGAGEIRFCALCDSGNLLRDPISGKRVLLVQSNTVAALFDGPGKALLQNLPARQPEEMLEQLRRCCKAAFWLLPLHTVTGESMILVFRPEQLWIDGRLTGEYLIGLSPADLAIGQDCQALIGV